MEWLERMNRMLDYIEAHLTDEITFDALARLANCSTYHLQRMFPFLTGVSLSEYIRRRRLTLAAFELQTTPIKVIDVSLKYGYESPEAFTRAFKKQHGIVPNQLHTLGVSLKAYPKITFHLSMKGASEMVYRIEHRDRFQVFGKSAVISTDTDAAFAQVPQFFRQCDEDGTTHRLNAQLGRFDDSYTLSALYDFGESSFRYMLCNYLPKDMAVPSEFERLTIPAGTWAIFDAPDCDAQAVWRRIWSEWLPTCGYELREGVQFEMYYGLARHENAFGEIWIPVSAKR